MDGTAGRANCKCLPNCVHCNPITAKKAEEQEEPVNDYLVVIKGAELQKEFEKWLKANAIETWDGNGVLSWVRYKGEKSKVYTLHIDP